MQFKAVLYRFLKNFAMMINLLDKSVRTSLKTWKLHKWSRNGLPWWKIGLMIAQATNQSRLLKMFARSTQAIVFSNVHYEIIQTCRKRSLGLRSLSIWRRTFKFWSNLMKLSSLESPSWSEERIIRSMKLEHFCYFMYWEPNLRILKFLELRESHCRLIKTFNLILHI